LGKWVKEGWREGRKAEGKEGESLKFVLFGSDNGGGGEFDDKASQG